MLYIIYVTYVNIIIIRIFCEKCNKPYVLEIEIMMAKSVPPSIFRTHLYFTFIAQYVIYVFALKFS